MCMSHTRLQKQYCQDALGSDLTTTHFSVAANVYTLPYKHIALIRQQQQRSSGGHKLCIECTFFGCNLHCSMSLQKMLYVHSKQEEGAEATWQQSLRCKASLLAHTVTQQMT